MLRLGSLALRAALRTGPAGSVVTVPGQLELGGARARPGLRSWDRADSGTREVTVRGGHWSGPAGPAWWPGPRNLAWSEWRYRGDRQLELEGGVTGVDRNAP